MAHWANRAMANARSVTTDEYGETGDADNAPEGTRNATRNTGTVAISA